jgi:hypothetical protein
MDSTTSSKTPVKSWINPGINIGHLINPNPKK